MSARVAEFDTPQQRIDSREFFDIFDDPDFSIEVTPTSQLSQAQTDPITFNSENRTLYISADLAESNPDDAINRAIDTIWSSGVNERISGISNPIYGGNPSATANFDDSVSYFQLKNIRENNVPYSRPPSDIRVPSPQNVLEENFGIEFSSHVAFQGMEDQVQTTVLSLKELRAGARPNTSIQYSFETNLTNTFRDRETGQILTTAFPQNAPVLPRGRFDVGQYGAGASGHDLGVHAANMVPVSIRGNHPLIQGLSNSQIDELIAAHISDVARINLGRADFPFRTDEVIEYTPGLQFLLKGNIEQTLLPDNRLANIRPNQVQDSPLRLADMRELIPSSQPEILYITSISPVNALSNPVLQNRPYGIYSHGGPLTQSVRTEFDKLFKNRPDILDFYSDRFTHMLQTTDYLAGEFAQPGHGNFFPEIDYVVPGHVVRPVLETKLNSLRPFANNGAPGVRNQIQLYEDLLRLGDNPDLLRQTPPNLGPQSSTPSQNGIIVGSSDLGAGLLDGAEATSLDNLGSVPTKNDVAATARFSEFNFIGDQDKQENGSPIAASLIAGINTAENDSSILEKNITASTTPLEEAAPNLLSTADVLGEPLDVVPLIDTDIFTTSFTAADLTLPDNLETLTLPNIANDIAVLGETDPETDFWGSVTADLSGLNLDLTNSSSSDVIASLTDLSNFSSTGGSTLDDEFWDSISAPSSLAPTLTADGGYDFSNTLGDFSTIAVSDYSVDVANITPLSDFTTDFSPAFDVADISFSVGEPAFNLGSDTLAFNTEFDSSFSSLYA